MSCTLYRLCDYGYSTTRQAILKLTSRHLARLDAYHERGLPRAYVETERQTARVLLPMQVFASSA